MNTVATPWLYQSFSAVENSTRLRPLLNTITQKPALARYIHRLDIRFGSVEYLEPPTKIELMQWHQDSKVLQTVENEYYQLLRHGLRCGLIAARAALLVFLAKNTKYLNFHSTSNFGQATLEPSQKLEHDSYFLVMVLARLKTNWSEHAAQLMDPVLRQLHGIRFIRDATCAHATLSTNLDTNIFFGLPTLTTYSSDHAAWFQTLQDPVDTNTLGNVANIKLSHCSMKSDHLVKMLASCRAIENLSVRWAAYECGRKLHVNLTQIMRALEPHKASLKMLVLDTMWSKEVLIAQPLAAGCLDAFSTLTSFEMDERALCSDDGEPVWEGSEEDMELCSQCLQQMLPPQPVRFQIHTVHHTRLLLEALKDLAATKQVLPDQLTLTFPKGYWRFTDWYLDYLEGLQQEGEVSICIDDTRCIPGDTAYDSVFDVSFGQRDSVHGLQLFSEYVQECRDAERRGNEAG